MAGLVLAPFEQVQHRLDEAALLSLYAIPCQQHGGTGWSSEGFASAGYLQRFESVVSVAHSDVRAQRFDPEMEQLLRKVLKDQLMLSDRRLLIRQQIGEAAAHLNWKDAGVQRRSKEFAVARSIVWSSSSENRALKVRALLACTQR